MLERSEPSGSPEQPVDDLGGPTLVRAMLFALADDLLGQPDLEKLAQSLDAECQWDEVMSKLSSHVTSHGVWAGSPRPLDDTRLVIEPRYPFPGLNGFKFGDNIEDQPTVTKDEDSDSPKIRNFWYNWKRHTTVYVVEDKDGKVRHAEIPENHEYERFKYLIDTLGCYRAWKPSAEVKAMRSLSELVSHSQMCCYMMTGMFLETSKRSGVIYLFRKLRPTVALSSRKSAKSVIPLCAMCLHPIGYYAGSFAGCLVPTDDVIAHLTMMRGDERGFWSKANQWPLWAANSGV